MIRVNVVVEGLTEEDFVKHALYPYYPLKNISQAQTQSVEQVTPEQQKDCYSTVSRYCSEQLVEDSQ